MPASSIHRPAKSRLLSPVPYTASPSVQAAIKRIGRTEDIRFSPDFSSLAIVGFNAKKVLILALQTCLNSDSQPTILLKDFLEVDCERFWEPHGVNWINDHTLIVANRKGGVDILELPEEWPASRHIQLDPIQTIHCDLLDGLDFPGSVALRPLGDGLHEVFICNNYKHYVSQHILDESDHYRVKSSSMLLRQDLQVPDGITLSQDGCWIAVSNHNSSLIHIYPSTADLNRLAQPAATLRGLIFPHGIRFTANSKALIAADAGSPYLHVYAACGGDWAGSLLPVESYQIMGDAMFLRGEVNPGEGGPKGIDIEPRANVLVASCAEQPLAFFDLDQMLINLPESARKATPKSIDLSDAEMQRAILMRHIAALSEAKLDLISLQNQQLHEFQCSTSWRLTAPLRCLSRLYALLLLAASAKPAGIKGWIRKRRELIQHAIWAPRIQATCRTCMVAFPEQPAKRDHNLANERYVPT